MPDKFAQTYADFKPAGKQCDAYWDIKGYDVKTLMPESFVPANIWDEKCE